MTKDAFIHQIHAAFGTDAVPKATNIVLGLSDEAVTVKRIFIGKNWTEVNFADLIYENSALGFLSERGFRYYLPAYMMLLLDDFVKADLVSSSVINQLTLPLEVDKLQTMNSLTRNGMMTEGLEKFLLEELTHSTDRVAFFIKRVSGFNDLQGQCIHAFLLCLGELYPDYFDRDELSIAIRRYWFIYVS